MGKMAEWATKRLLLDLQNQGMVVEREAGSDALILKETAESEETYRVTLGVELMQAETEEADDAGSVDAGRADGPAGGDGGGAAEASPAAPAGQGGDPEDETPAP